MAKLRVLRVGTPHVLMVSGIGDIGSLADDVDLSLDEIGLSLDARGVLYIGVLSLREAVVSSIDSAKEERVMCWGRGGSSRCPSISIGVVRNTCRDDAFDKLRNP